MLGNVCASTPIKELLQKSLGNPCHQSRRPQGCIAAAGSCVHKFCYTKSRAKYWINVIWLVTLLHKYGVLHNCTWFSLISFSNSRLQKCIVLNSVIRVERGMAMPWASKRADIPARSTWHGHGRSLPHPDIPLPAKVCIVVNSVIRVERGMAKAWASKRADIPTQSTWVWAWQKTKYGFTYHLALFRGSY